MPGACAIVTGGGTGIGAAIARRLAADGRPVVVGRRAEPIDALASELPEALALSADVSRPEDCERVVAATVERFGASTWSSTTRESVTEIGRPSSQPT